MEEEIVCLYVILEDDVYKEEVESIIQAVRTLRGVDSVEAGTVDQDYYKGRISLLKELREELAKISDKLD